MTLPKETIDKKQEAGQLTLHIVQLANDIRKAVFVLGRWLAVAKSDFNTLNQDEIYYLYEYENWQQYCEASPDRGGLGLNPKSCDRYIHIFKFYMKYCEITEQDPESTHAFEGINDYTKLYMIKDIALGDKEQAEKYLSMAKELTRNDLRIELKKIKMGDDKRSLTEPPKAYELTANQWINFFKGLRTYVINLPKKDYTRYWTIKKMTEDIKTYMDKLVEFE